MRPSSIGALLLAIVVACGSSASGPSSSPATPSGPAEPGHAELLARQQTGGRLALIGDRADATEDAKRQMIAHCGTQAFQIVAEGEEPIDANPSRAGDTQYAEDGVYGSSASSTTAGGAAARGGGSTDDAPAQVRWVITYQCSEPPR